MGALLDGPHNHGQPLSLSELANLIRQMDCFFWIFVPHTSRYFLLVDYTNVALCFLDLSL